MTQEQQHKGFNFKSIEKIDKNKVNFKIKVNKSQEDYMGMKRHKSTRKKQDIETSQQCNCKKGEAEVS